MAARISQKEGAYMPLERRQGKDKNIKPFKIRMFRIEFFLETRASYRVVYALLLPLPRLSAHQHSSDVSSGE